MLFITNINETLMVIDCEFTSLNHLIIVPNSHISNDLVKSSKASTQDVPLLKK